jgi:transposase
MAKSKWDQVKSELRLVKKWARDGLREDQICKNLGISVTTLEVYKKQYPEVVKAL